MKYQVKKATPGIGHKYDARLNLTLTDDWQTVAELTPKIKKWIQWGEADCKETTGTPAPGGEPAKEPRAKGTQPPGKK